MTTVTVLAGSAWSDTVDRTVEPLALVVRTTTVLADCGRLVSADAGCELLALAKEIMTTVLADGDATD